MIKPQIALGVSSSEISDFVLFLVKEVGSMRVTRRILRDLWQLVSPTTTKTICDLVALIDDELTSLAVCKKQLNTNIKDIPGLRFDLMITEVYAEKRRRPLTKGKFKTKSKNDAV